MEIHTTQDLASAVRGRRRALKLPQAKVAAEAGVSRVWLSEFETGKPTVEFGRVLSVLETLNFRLYLQGPDLDRSVDRSAPVEVADLDSLMAEYDRGQD